MLEVCILFTIIDVFEDKNKTNACYQRIQKIRNRNFIHPGVNHSLS